jgi:O-antigen/teichoic acid export membrane protein
VYRHEQRSVARENGTAPQFRATRRRGGGRHDSGPIAYRDRRPHLGPNVVRLIPSEPDPKKKRIIAGTHLRAVILLTLPTAPVIALFATIGLIGHGDFVLAFALTTTMIVIEAVRMMLSDIFAAVGRVRASVATMAYLRSTLALPAVGVIVIVVDRPTLVEMLAVYTAVAGAHLAAALWVGRTDFTTRRIKAGAVSMRTAISAGAGVFTLDLTRFAMGPGTIFLANAVFTPEAATSYSAAATIATQATVLQSLVWLAANPPAARLWAAGHKPDVGRLLANLATATTAVTVLAVTALWVFGDAALEFAYGPSMGEANVLLVTLACPAILQAALSANPNLLIVDGHIKQVSRMALAVLAAALPGTIAAAFLGGPMALAVASAAGMSSLWVGGWLITRRILGWTVLPRANLPQAFRELVSRSTPGLRNQSLDDRRIQPMIVRPDPESQPQRGSGG